MQKISPCLWFNDQAEEAANFYTSLFKNSSIGKTARYSGTGAKVSGRKEGSVMTIELDLNGFKLMGLNGGPHFKFTPALSFFVYCESEKEINHLWKELAAGGEARMALDKYPWSERYGWTADKFGVDWQLMLSPQKASQKIVPAFLFVDQLFGKGEEAINFYMSIFEHSKIEVMNRDEATRSIMHCAFSLDGNDLVLMEGQGKHNFSFSPAFSFVVSCQNQEEIDKYWSKLTAGGSESQCGWLTDRYGVAWQIVPSMMGELMSDPKKSEAVMKVMLGMKKLDIEKLKGAKF